MRRKHKAGERFLSRTLLFIWVAIGLALSCGPKAYALTYSREDSLKVVELLSEGCAQPRGTNLMLYFGHRLENVPYVPSTLEVNEEEELVVNLRELDCTTFVETVVALVLSARSENPSWKTYCDYLERIRYSKGKNKGYTSRNHYFSQWIKSNESLGFVAEQVCDCASRKQHLDLHYMSKHPSSYAMLNGRKDRIREIGAAERMLSGKVVRYIPCESLGKKKGQLKCVQDGDILAIVTKKDGLDVCHLGLAEWAKDGKLHLLNASSIHKKVVLESMTLQHYMQQHPSQLGVRVVRVLPLE